MYGRTIPLLKKDKIDKALLFTYLPQGGIVPPCAALELLASLVRPVFNPNSVFFLLLSLSGSISMYLLRRPKNLGIKECMQTCNLNFLQCLNPKPVLVNNTRDRMEARCIIRPSNLIVDLFFSILQTL